MFGPLATFVSKYLAVNITIKHGQGLHYIPYIELSCTPKKKISFHETSEICPDKINLSVLNIDHHGRPIPSHYILINTEATTGRCSQRNR